MNVIANTHRTPGYPCHSLSTIKQVKLQIPLARRADLALFGFIIYYHVCKLYYF